MSVVQIAAEAGVSIATVSRVLNNSRRVNPQLADQVHRAMRTLNMDASHIRRRSPNRRSHTEDRAGTIAIVALGQRYVGWFEIPIIAAVVAEITRAALDRNLRTLIAEMPNPTELNPVLRSNVDGAIVFVDSVLPPEAPALLARQLPTVRVMGGQFAPSPIDHVGVDNNAVGYLAGQTLLARGCDGLGFLTMRPTWEMTRLRSHGLVAAAVAAGKQAQGFIVGSSEQFGCAFGADLTAAEDGRAIVEVLAKRLRSRPAGSKPFGLFVSRDEETVLIYRHLAEAGLRPGQDVMIVSCDNEPVRLNALEPRPTSIDLNVAEIARRAVQRLGERMDRRDDPPVRILVNPRLGQLDSRHTPNGVPPHSSLI